MLANTLEAHAHRLLDQLSPDKLVAVVGLLEAMLDSPDEQPGLELPQAIRQSRDYFLAGGDGISMEQLASECGFTMDEILTAQPTSKA